VDQWSTPRCWGGGARVVGQDLGAPCAAHGLGAAPARPVGQLAGEPLTGVPAAPGDHGGSGGPQPLRDLGVGHALRASRILARRTSAAGAWVASTQRRSTAWSSALTGRAAADDGMRECSRPADQPVESP
jgi:hypothetical protein